MRIKKVKEWEPYHVKDDGSFIIIIDLEKEHVLEYNHKINTLAIYKFKSVDALNYWFEHTDYRTVIRKIFEIEITSTL